jgi:hypothetical protein
VLQQREPVTAFEGVNRGGAVLEGIARFLANQRVLDADEVAVMFQRR